MANLLAYLRESERGEPNFVEGLASERSSGGVIALKRGLLSIGVDDVLLMMEVVDCGAKALEVPAAASRQEMSKGRRRAIVVDEMIYVGWIQSHRKHRLDMYPQDLSSPSLHACYDRYVVVAKLHRKRSPLPT